MAMTLAKPNGAGSLAGVESAKSNWLMGGGKFTDCKSSIQKNSIRAIAGLCPLLPCHCRPYLKPISLAIQPLF
jgi:hypothetical protein